MKYIDEFDIELVNQALTFDTSDIHLHTSCDLFTTKPIGTDRKLYKTLDKLYSTEQQQQQQDDSGNNKGSNTVKNRANSDASLDSTSSSVDSSFSSSSSHQYISPEFMKIKKRSFSYSYGGNNTIPPPFQNQHHRHYSSSHDRRTIRSKSFHVPYLSPQSLPKQGLLSGNAIESFDLNTGYSPEEANVISDSNYPTISNGNPTTDDYLESSPFGPLSKQSSRRLFAYLIGILNSSFPDHDFSTVQPSNFHNGFGKLSTHIWNWRIVLVSNMNRNKHF
ncbi:unnamed protein product [Ambrosiozyma monospora]|uniref:Unnamed protein product n=1 Tax=Ambrosiozyma monospora TaxID=43982 RepID=A0ACB5U7J0_AMBMO|nr:unnamed protein product [Ambrosiozyma monospora]